LVGDIIKGASMAVERRKSKRINLACNVMVIFGERILLFNTHSENLSGGGIKVVIWEKLHVGTSVELELFFAENQKSSKCRGQISWVRQKTGPGSEGLFNTGIKFIDMSNSVQEEIKKLLGG